MMYIDAHGTRVETQDATASCVVFWPQGGGFRASVDHDKFHELFKPAPAPTWRAGTTSADWFDEGVTFPCWSNGDHWNGWGMPYFTKATVDALIAAMTGLSETVRWVDGKLMMTDEQEDDTYEVPPITISECPEPLYGLGAGNWCWDSIEFNKDPK